MKIQNFIFSINPIESSSNGVQEVNIEFFLTYFFKMLKFLNLLLTQEVKTILNHMMIINLSQLK